MPAERIHLVRHGEVHNPEHVVYADLPGFGLSDRGKAQAQAAAVYLRASPVRGIVASPLLRARETAAAIAGAVGVDVGTDTRLTEWGLARRWAGVAWEDLPTRRPGELEAYLLHPDDLPFAEEPLIDLAIRTAAAAGEQAARLDTGDLVVVSHQDPIHAARRHLTGTGLADFHDDKPGHAAVITLEAVEDGYIDAGHWEPPQGEHFPPKG